MPAPKIDAASIVNTELFSSLLENERRYVSSRSGIIQLRKGERLFSSGEKAERFYMLLKGAIHVFRTEDDGGADEMARFDPGDTIGDFDFARGAVYNASAEAEKDSVLAVFPRLGLTMDMLAHEDPHAVSHILLSSIIMITSRIKSTQKIIVENISWVQEIYRRAYEDAGTGLWKQAFLTDEINRILEEPTALIMLKPDNFKILVDSRGHAAGDEAMVRIALVLKAITRKIGRGWALRFKSNEVGLLINKCSADAAGKIARELHASIAALEPVPAENGNPEFCFTGTVSYTIWPGDGGKWDALFQENYESLLSNWRTQGNRVVHYRQGVQA